MKPRAPVLALLTATLVFGACTDESINPRDGAASGGRGGAEILHTIAASLPADQRADATFALERDAFRREHRFLDAVNPGHLFQSTRVDQAAIEAGAWTPEELFQIGGQLFNFTFTAEVGYGGRDLPSYGRFQTGRRGSLTPRGARRAIGAADRQGLETRRTTPISTATGDRSRARSRATPSPSRAQAWWRSWRPR